jgi:glycosyltransferase involved in cell wall biosynthesis
LYESFDKKPDNIVVVDAGSTDGSVPYWLDKSFVITVSLSGRNLQHLSHALNEGIQHAIEAMDAEFVVWLHADMKIVEQDWLEKMIERFQKDDVGKLHPFNVGDGRADHGDEHPGNSCPWMIRTDLLKLVSDRRSELSFKTNSRHRTRPKNELECFNEGYIGIGGYEDWDLNNVILDIGKSVLISPVTKIYHSGMGTRERRDTTFEQRYNASLYAHIWGDAKPRV